MRKLPLVFCLFCLLATMSGAASAVDVAGVVLNDIGRPAANATVVLKKISNPGNAMTVVTDTTGTFSFTVSEPAGVNEPVSFALYGNYPNPFNPTTRVSYSLGEPAEVSMAIYSVLGQKVRTIVGGYREPGFHTVVWDGSDDMGRPCAAGVYLYRLSAGGNAAVSKMLMVDSATGSLIGGGAVSPASYKGAEKSLFTITVTHPDAKSATAGPMSLSGATGLVITIDRIMDKMQLVKKNTYTRGSIWYHYSSPLHKVSITHDYYVDKYEVTADLFARVMNHALGRGALNTDSLTVKSKEGGMQPLFILDTPAAPTNIGIELRDGVFRVKEGRGKYPVASVSWYGAMFFCYERNLMEGYPQAVDITKWTCDFDADGYRLPTDAEWELAAAWTDLREYAFGPDPGEYRPMNTQLNADGFEDELAPSGWFSPQGDTHDGICDMSGNLYEWTWEWMEYYHPEWEKETLVNPSGPEKGWNKVVRGGSAYGCFRAARTGDRASVPINRMTDDIGFRSIRKVSK